MISSNNSPLFFWIHIWSFYQKAFARQGFPFFPPGFFTKNRIWITTGILVFLIALSLRSWDNLTHPGLYVEDAGYFNYYYGGDRPLSAVFDRGRGYMNVINHMYAWLVSRVDVRVQPGLYLLFSIMIGIVTAVNLLFSGLFKSKLILLIAPLVLGLTGMNHIFYYNTLVYQFYTTVLLLLCLLFFPAPRTRSGWVGICVVYIILSWSGPYSILAVPTGLLLLLFFKDRRKGFLLFITIISTLLYFTTVKNGTTILNHIVNGQVMGLYFKTLFKEIFFLGLLGNPTIAKVGIFLFCLMVLFYLQRKDKEYLKLSLVFFALIIGALAPFFLSYKFNPNYKSCHLLISFFFYLVFLLYSLDKLFLRARLKQIPVVFVLFFLMFVAVDNYPPQRKRVKVKERIPAFVDTIYHYEQLDLEKQNVFVILRFEDAYFKPKALVGSRQPSAKHVGADYFKTPFGKEFIVDPGG